MAKMKDYRAFTIRIPPDMADQIEARAEINGRSRNSECIKLLERGIDLGVESDLRIKSRGKSDQTQAGS